MTRQLGLGFGLVGFFAGWAALPLAAQDAMDAQNKLLAKRAAEADVYRKLAESIQGVRINSETYVRDFVTESDQIRAGVDALVRGVRLGPPPYFEDGVCEIDGEVTVAKLVTTLKELHATHYKGNVVKTTDIEQINESIKTDIIRATGSGAPRPELPPGLPNGVEEMLTPIPGDYQKKPMLMPPIWRAAGPPGRLLAMRAAELDAMRKLLEQIKGVRLNSETLVRDFITESDEIRAQSEGIVIGATHVSSYLHSDELIAEVTMEVPVEKVITRIKELHSEHYKGNKVTTTDITNIKESIQRDMIRATGSGVPRPDLVAKAAAEGYEAPVWMAKTIEAVGQGTDPAIDTAQGKLKAARAAELDAMRKLSEQIYGLQISSSTTVKDFVTQHDEISTQVQAVLSGAVADAPTFSEGAASVRVTLLAADVWSVINHHKKIVQRKG